MIVLVSPSPRSLSPRDPLRSPLNPHDVLDTLFEMALLAMLELMAQEIFRVMLPKRLDAVLRIGLLKILEKMNQA